jgi:hypothetical protein
LAAAALSADFETLIYLIRRHPTGSKSHAEILSLSLQLRADDSLFKFYMPDTFSERVPKV